MEATENKTLSQAPCAQQPHTSRETKLVQRTASGRDEERNTGWTTSTRTSSVEENVSHDDENSSRGSTSCLHDEGSLREEEQCGSGVTSGRPHVAKTWSREVSMLMETTTPLHQSTAREVALKN